MAGFDPVAAHRNAGVPVSGRSWTDFSADGDDLASVIFNRCTFTRVRFERTRFMGAMFLDCRFDECTFHDCDLERTQWVECRGALVRVAGEATRCVQSTFVSCSFDTLEIETSADRLILAESAFARLAFSGPGLSQHAPTFSKLSVDRFDARGAHWIYASALEAPLASWSIEGASFERCVFIEADVAGADLSTVRAERCSFHQSSLEHAVLRFAPGSIFSSCAVSGLDAAEALLDGALFERVDCEAACFERTRLERAMLVRSQWRSCDFSGAVAPGSAWVGSNFSECSLHGVQGSLAGTDLTGCQGTVEWRAGVRRGRTRPCRLTIGRRRRPRPNPKRRPRPPRRRTVRCSRAFSTRTIPCGRTARPSPMFTRPWSSRGRATAVCSAAERPRCSLPRACSFPGDDLDAD